MQGTKIKFVIVETNNNASAEKEERQKSLAYARDLFYDINNVERCGFAVLDGRDGVRNQICGAELVLHRENFVIGKPLGI